MINKTNIYRTVMLFAGLMFISLSCKRTIEYPKYSLDTIKYVPDTLNLEYRTWITETVRAASQHMTGGDYEDVDATIRQTKRTADDLFQVSVVGLNKEINDNYWDDISILPRNMDEKQKHIFDSLINLK